MNRLIITANQVKTICWQEDKLIDWAGGKIYSLDGTCKELGQYYAYSFDSAVSSAGGQYVFIYQKLGTKGILLKNGELLREINRSYYFANAYEYPAAIAAVGDKIYLIHCPIACNQLDFEDVETGEIITNIKGRNPDDRFHSRLELSPDGKYLMSRGWIWHPVDEVSLFNIKDCLNNPQLLDCPQFQPLVGVEIYTASFLDNETILLSSTDEVLDEELCYSVLPPKHFVRWNFNRNQFSEPVSFKSDFGNLFAIDAYKAWDMYGYPKIIDVNTGEILAYDSTIDTGKQQSSIIQNTADYPSIVYNRNTKQIAIKSLDVIHVFTP